MMVQKKHLGRIAIAFLLGGVFSTPSQAVLTGQEKQELGVAQDLSHPNSWETLKKLWTTASSNQAEFRKALSPTLRKIVDENLPHRVEAARLLMETGNSSGSVSGSRALARAEKFIPHQASGSGSSSHASASMPSGSAASPPAASPSRAGGPRVSAAALFDQALALFDQAQEGNTESLKQLKKRASEGDVYAQYNLGVLYRKGRGVSQNDELAINWLQKAAKKGDEVAQYNLGLLYQKGRGVQHYERAAYWLQKAAEQGNKNAQYYLGASYLDGLGVSQDDAQAAYWLQKAADQGDEEARELLVRIRRRVEARGVAAAAGGASGNGAASRPPRSAPNQASGSRDPASRQADRVDSTDEDIG